MSYFIHPTRTRGFHIWGIYFRIKRDSKSGECSHNVNRYRDEGRSVRGVLWGGGHSVRCF